MDKQVTERVNIHVDPYAAITDPTVQALCVQLAAKHYIRFNNIRFTQSGLIVTSEDQGGYPFPAVTLSVAACPEAIARACLGMLQALCVVND